MFVDTDIKIYAVEDLENAHTYQGVDQRYETERQVVRASEGFSHCRSNIDVLAVMRGCSNHRHGRCANDSQHVKDDRAKSPHQEARVLIKAGAFDARQPHLQVEDLIK